MLKIVISSYAELILLLLASIYPVLISLGIRPITAVSVLSLITLDYGPKDGNSINMAKMVGEPDNVVGLFFELSVMECCGVCCYYRSCDTAVLCVCG